MEKVGKFVYFYIKIDFFKSPPNPGKKLSLILPFKDIESIAFSQNLSILKKILNTNAPFFGSEEVLQILSSLLKWLLLDADFKVTFEVSNIFWDNIKIRNPN